MRKLAINAPGFRNKQLAHQRRQDLDSIRAIITPYAGRFFDDRSRSEIVFRGLRRSSTGSAPPWPARGRGSNDDATGFTSCCGLVGCTPPRSACHSTSTSPFRATPGVSYRGPWRLPGPDLHRLATLNLTSGYIVHISSELGGRPDCWTYAWSLTSGVEWRAELDHSVR